MLVVLDLLLLNHQSVSQEAQTQGALGQPLLKPLDVTQATLTPDVHSLRPPLNQGATPALLTLVVPNPPHLLLLAILVLLT